MNLHYRYFFLFRMIFTGLAMWAMAIGGPILTPFNAVALALLAVAWSRQ